MCRRKDRKSPCAIYCWFFQVVTLLSLISLLIWACLKVRNPNFTITNIYIPALAATQDSSTIYIPPKERIQNASLVFFLEISNPNKGKRAYYSDINMNLGYGDLLVGTTSMEAFDQGSKKVESREVVIDADQQFWQGITSGNVDLRVTVETAVKYKILNWKTKTGHLGFEGFVRIGGTDGNMTMAMKIHKTP